MEWPINTSQYSKYYLCLGLFFRSLVCKFNAFVKVVTQKNVG